VPVSPTLAPASPTLVPTTSGLGHAPTDAERSTRDHILRLVVEEGPVSVVQLAHDLELTTAGVRRHVAALLDAGEIVEHAVPALGRQGRGRPPRRYVATSRGQAVLTDAYSELAAQALAFLAEVAGEQAVRDFAHQRVAELGYRHAAAVERADTVQERVAALAEGLSADGYAASVRPLPGGRAVQLCQGHCPVQAVAARYPQLCEAEAHLFSDLLGVQVQRLSTLAAGGHVCTTHVSLTTPDQRAPFPVTVEGTR
jgi:predicted ArsR family transcriptional regulator